MRSLLSPAHYYTDAIYQRECERIFRRVWMLAAIRPMLAKHLDFRTLEIGRVPVLLQNFNGRVRAYANICRHRLSRIHALEFGSAPLACPYHQWAYDADGVLEAVPSNDELFQFSKEQMRAIRLREYSVEIVGGLVFVNLAENPLPIQDQFSPGLLAVIADATSRMDHEYVHTRYSAGFNWKTGIENIKDPLHVQCLHRDSFPANIDTRNSLQTAPPVDHDAQPARAAIPLSGASTVWDVPIAGRSPHPWYELVENLDSKDFYRGVHLFPNVNLMIVAGTSFSVQIYNPVGPDCTEMHMSVALTRPVAEFSYKPVVLWEHIRSDMSVLKEDLDCLEAMQGNFRAAEHGIQHGAYEGGIMHYHSAYLDLLDKT